MPKSITSGFNNVISRLFPSYSEKDDRDGAIVFESGPSATGGYRSTGLTPDTDHGGGLAQEGKSDNDRIFLRQLPNDRFAKYRVFNEMASDSTLSAALDMHLAHALSVDPRAGVALTLQAVDEEHQEFVATLEKDVMSKINRSIVSWTKPMLIYGVNYVRPYGTPGVGITHFEACYYTLPHNIREYERAGEIAGYTSENLRTRKSGEQVRLAEPWALVPLKVPFWQSSMESEPINYSNNAYSLYDEVLDRSPLETQNYGTSFLEFAFESWCDMREALLSLKASRRNASISDRFVSVSTDGLDSARAAEYINLVAGQLTQDQEAASRRASVQGFIPTVLTRIIPVAQGGAKQGVNIDTHSTDPNIQHLEDILFHAKRLAASIGIDISMLGFSEMLGGNLGQGGYFRTAIQAALRAQWIRMAIIEFVDRSLDIHIAYKHGKAFPDGEKPWRVNFHSMNTALETEEQEANETRASYASMVVGILDMLENGKMAQSETFKKHLYENLLNFDSESAAEISKELANAVSEDDQFMESAGLSGVGQSDINAIILSELDELKRMADIANQYTTKENEHG
ncbi:hypothetical protein [Thaumasiovibrio sp. DFM-14]|uniref:hypothetical protein n=1 Tax=Thaumasiovibrio sp. DFM-14 TaxID=3384792 RepID=UPI0039A20B88